MARNGSGTYTLPAGNPVTTGTTISSTWANNTLNDIGNAMTASLAYDGQTTPVANLPMGSYIHTGVGNATARTNYASAAQVQDSTLTYLTSVSGTDTITALAPLSMNTYAAGQVFRFIAAGANTTTGVTLNINSTGAKSITKNGTTALVAGDIPSGSLVTVNYDGTQFQLVAPASVPANVSSFTAGTTGLTPSTATTGAVTLAGTLNVANGGTGSTTLTANSVVLGNGTSALSSNLIAPSTSGNVLTSNGTTWASSTNLAVGVGQSWTDVKSSRALGTTYTNSTGKPIQLSVSINFTAAANSEISISVNSVVIGGLADTYGGNSPALKMGLQHIIPNGATYVISIVQGSPTISTWFELR